MLVHTGNMQPIWFENFLYRIAMRCMHVVVCSDSSVPVVAASPLTSDAAFHGMFTVVYSSVVPSVR